MNSKKEEKIKKTEALFYLCECGDEIMMNYMKDYHTCPCGKRTANPLDNGRRGINFRFPDEKSLLDRDEQ